MTIGDSQANNSGINFNDPYYLSNGDHPGMQFGNHVLTGSSYLNWSRAMKMALISTNKLQFVDGSLPMPSEGSADFQKWIRNDDMVMSWILNSMDKTLAESFMFVNTSYQLWAELAERFDHTTAPRLLFELHRSLTSIQQIDSSIAEYFGKLKDVWNQLQILEGYPDCSCGAMKTCSCGILKKFLEIDQRNKLMQLLCGLNKDYDQVITNLLSFPEWWDKDCGKNPRSGFRMAASADSSVGILGKGPKEVDNVDPVMASAVYNEVLKMMQKQNSTSMQEDNPLCASANYAGISSISNVDNVSKVFYQNNWIIDTGASDHMASNLALFASIKQLKNPIQVSLPNGTVTIVKHIGAIKLNPDVSLHNVFYIPQFKHNLLSVGKLLDYNNLLVVFEPNSCYFQDPTTKQ
ncbi:Retrovirus-related Pol polyprotein from transposon RE1 [Bienertia sinuspersici]